MRFTVNKIIIVLLAITGILIATACQEDTELQDKTAQELRLFNLYAGANYPGNTPRSDGLYFIEHKAGTGASPDSDDWVLINHVCYKIPEDDIYESYIENVAIDNHFYDSVAMYGPYKLLNGSRNPGLTEGLTLMKEGSQATIFFSSELGYGVDGTADIAPYQSLKYEVELLEVIKDIDVYEETRINNYMDTVPQFDTIRDPDSDAIMYYIIDESSDGNEVVPDSLAEIAYKGYLMDGRVFDERTAANPFTLTVGADDVIKGWDLGLLKLHEGEKARFIIPYQMAYGEDGRKDGSSGLRTIPPYETLLFEIEIVGVREDPSNTKND